MRTTDVARRYAKALLSLTRQKGVHAKAFAELKTIHGLLAGNPAVDAYFKNPLVTPDQKQAVLKKSFEGQGLLDEVVSFMDLLAFRNRVDQLGGIIEAFQQGLDDEQGITRGTVRAARALSADGMKDLETKLSSALKKKIVLTFKEDPKLLGGLVAEAGGWTFDDSLETHLKNMNEDLNRSAT